MQTDGFRVAYNTDAEFAKRVQRLMALAFVPVVDEVTTFEELTADDSYRQIKPLATYFEENFIGRLLRRNLRASPCYDIALWNLYDRVLQRLPRSNNAVKGWYNAFNNVVGIAHPPGPNLSQKFQAEQHSALLFCRQRELGQPQPKKKCIYQQIDDAFYAIVSDYDNRNAMQYLSDISCF